MPGGFEVDVPTLHEGARWLRGDGAEVTEIAGRGENAGLDAQAASGGGPLGVALSTFAAEMGSRCTGAGEAVAWAGDTLATNAVGYTADDDSAAYALGETMPEDGG